MAWENANKNWPERVIVSEDSGLIRVDEVLKLNPGVVFSIRQEVARNMLTNQKRYIWGKDGEFAIGIDYDVMNCLPRPDEEHPALNVYGMRMLRDYKVLNNIDIDE